MAYDVFISYAREDEEHRKALVRHLATLRHQGLVNTWDRGLVQAGTKRADEVASRLEAADVVLLLVSADYVASESWDGEMARVLERTERDGAVVVPVIVRPCDWRAAPFGGLQPLPRNEEAVTVWTNADSAWAEVAAGLRELIAERPPKNTRRGVPFRIPYARNPYFTGRADVLEALRDQLVAEGTVAIGQTAAISGLGGIGKTQSAVEYAYRHQDDYPAGVFFVRAETRGELLGGFAELAETFGGEGQDQEALAAAARRWLEEKTGWLLIVDNADEPAIAKELLPVRHRGHLVVTSRASSFAELGIAGPLRMQTLPPDEAVALLLARAERKEAGDEERQAASALAEELGFLPLALEQAGAYVQETGAAFGDYLAAWKKRGLELLSKKDPVAGIGHDPVAVTWSLNFEAVEATSPASADVLRASAFLAPEEIPDELLLEGGDELGEPVASALGDGDPLAVSELLAPLLRYSLVERDAEVRTWSVHRLVRAVVRESVGEEVGVWRERVLMALVRAFPQPEFPVWRRCEQLTGHVLVAVGEVEDSLELTKLLNSTATYLDYRARYAEAEPLFLRLLAIREKIQGEEHPNVAVALNNLAEHYRHEGRFSEVEPFQVRALAIREKMLGEDHPHVATSLNNLASLYADQGRYAEAEPLYLRALAIWEKALGEHPDVATALNNLANLYNTQGRYAEAEPLFVRAIAIDEKESGQEHPDLATDLHNLALLYAEQGRYVEAEPLYLRAITIDEKALGNAHPSLAEDLENYTKLLRATGRYAEAEEVETRARAVRARHAAQQNGPP